MDDSKEKIRINQVWQSQQNLMRIEIIGKKGDNWKTRILTDKHGIYAGTHTMNKYTLRARFKLVPKETLQKELDDELRRYEI